MVSADVWFVSLFTKSNILYFVKEGTCVVYLGKYDGLLVSTIYDKKMGEEEP